METQRSTYEVTATRKRPQDFDRLVGQDFVVSTLENAIKENRIAHAYLFSGPRGVGKTSSARLLAKSLNCHQGMSVHPCGVCDSCREISKGTSVDVIEIDGASNTSVNDIRAIKEEIMFPPQSSRYKIYIIDEVHMLSTSAFNALLKTIEEPPEYIIFIFATTELQKVPLTIRSRCQQFKFRLISQELVMECLRSAAEDIGMKADEDALFWIAKETTGSMRDAYTLFDQVASFSEGHITLEKIRKKLAVAGFSAIAEIAEDSISGDEKGAMEKLAALFSQGVSPEEIVKDGADFFRTLLLYKKGIRRPDILGSALSDIPVSLAEALSAEQMEAALKAFLSLYRELRFSLSPRFEIELLFARLSALPALTSPDILIGKLEEMKKGIAEGQIVIKKAPDRIIERTERSQAEEMKPAEEKAVEEEPAPAEEPPAEESGNELPPPSFRKTLSADDIPQIADEFLKAGKSIIANQLGDVIRLENGDDAIFLVLSKALSFNNLKLQQKELERAFSAAAGYPVTLRFKLEEARKKENLSENMQRLKAMFGGNVVIRENTARAAIGEDEDVSVHEGPGESEEDGR